MNKASLKALRATAASESAQSKERTKPFAINGTLGVLLASIGVLLAVSYPSATALIAVVTALAVAPFAFGIILSIQS
jgi:hypothetical protein